MTTQPRPAPVPPIAPATRIGVVGLTVADLDRAVAFYTGALGCALLQRSDPDAILGAAGTPLLILREQRGAQPWMVDAMTGLYHVAILLPERADLGRWLRHFLALPYPPPGQGDHIVSEAFYLRDPDGHGIEVYWDRPRATWTWTDGRVRMGTGPVDVRGLLAEAERAGQPWRGLPAGATIGHIHLQVGDIEQAAAFYHGRLGFDVVAQAPGALFVAAGGYHHHLGLNTWHSQGAAPAPADTAGLRFFTLALPDEAARAALVERVAAAVPDGARAAGAVAITDPWRHRILLHAGPIATPAAAVALAAAWM